MGPKKKAVIKTEQNLPSINDPVNTNEWKCVVVMAVERCPLDSFVLRIFADEAVKGLRQDVKHIDWETFVLRILQEFATGELPFKYMFLLNFQSVFQEAAEYVKNKLDVPVPLLAKVIKALLLFLRHESLNKMEKKARGIREPIQAMADRPSFIDDSDSKLKRNEPEATKDVKDKKDAKGKDKENKLKDKIRSNEKGMKVRPPSSFKLDTTLTKRGESAGDSECIEDAPENGYFQLYVLLTGFYEPDFPMELLKAGIPLHGLICIDTSMSGVKHVTESAVLKVRKKTGEEKIVEVQRFWDYFLKSLWNPNTCHIFKDTVFQVYVPRMLLCGEKQLKEFIYREISFLMYDLSDITHRLKVYLNHLKLYDVRDKSYNENHYLEEAESEDELNELHCECVTVPVVLQHMFDVICGYNDYESVDLSDSDMNAAQVREEEISESNLSDSILGKYGSFAPTPVLSQILNVAPDFNKVTLSAKIKELDIRYNLDDRSYFYTSLGKLFNAGEYYEEICKYRKIGGCGANMEMALNTDDGVFGSYWKNHPKKQDNFTFSWDYCLCALLACRVLCPYELPPPFPSIKSSQIFKSNSLFKSIDNLEIEMHKPHFTVTEGSRTILKSFPFNLKDANKNFFCCDDYKIVTPKKVKASSAPEFLVSPKLYPKMPYASVMLSPQNFLSKHELNVFQNIRDFLGEDVFENVKGFCFVEELSKSKLLSRESEFWDVFNCIDCNYSVLLDSLFIVLHNRSDGENTRHETFNETLRTTVGLRDFFEYVLDDEAEWFKSYENSCRNTLTKLAQKSFQKEMFKGVSDSDFLLENSIKYQEYLQKLPPIKSEMKDMKPNKKEQGKGNTDKGISRKESFKEKSLSMDLKMSFEHKMDDFVGYDVGDIAIQFSGLKTLYCVEDCMISVQLLERLYGDQCLSVQVQQAGHNLYLYSYACPVPHLRNPYTFNVTYKNGIILAFGRRYIDTLGDKDDSRVLKSISVTEYSDQFKSYSGDEEDLEFLYDMSLSLPNGLTVKTVRRFVSPCYIKQKYLIRNNKYSETIQKEDARIFLPNGSVVKMLSDGTFEVLKSDTSIVNADLNSLVEETVLTETDELKSVWTLPDYEIITSLGQHQVVSEGLIESETRYPVFKKSDLQTSTTYYRRKDGLNYMEQGTGTICIQFTDNTKISKTVIADDDYLENVSNFSFGEESFFGSDYKDMNFEEENEQEFVMVHTEVIIEHPDYATVKFNSQTQVWKIYLPFESKICISPDGQYYVEIDSRTELKVEHDIIKMTRYKADDTEEPYCSVTADLQVFKNRGNMYCQMRDGLGKVFVVEPNSNCYSFNEETLKDISIQSSNIKSTTRASKTGGGKTPVHTALSQMKNFGGAATKASVSSVTNEGKKDVGDSRDLVHEDIAINEIFYGSKVKYDNPGKKLRRDNKYFVVKRDITGYEIMHRYDVEKLFLEGGEGTLVYMQDLPGMDNVRCFTLMQPPDAERKKTHKWEVESRLPDPKFNPENAIATTSSCYGDPSSWIHPFVNKPKKLQLPESLTCRVFIETKRSKVYLPTAAVGAFSNLEYPEPKYTIIRPGPENIQNYLKKLTNNDQNILKEMYLLCIKRLEEEHELKIKLEKAPYDEKLKNYLELSKHHNEMQEYHKHSIRFNIIPNYFHHPLGISWLIINRWIDEMGVNEKTREKPKFFRQVKTKSVKSVSEFSYEEIEYNLKRENSRSFSSLTFKSDLSMKSALATIITRKTSSLTGLKTERKTRSCPIITMGRTELNDEDRETDTYDKISTCCLTDRFQGDKKSVSNYTTINDLMALCLV